MLNHAMLSPEIAKIIFTDRLGILLTNNTFIDSNCNESHNSTSSFRPEKWQYD